MPSHPVGPEMASHGRTYGTAFCIGSSPMILSSPCQRLRCYPIPQRVQFVQSVLSSQRANTLPIFWARGRRMVSSALVGASTSCLPISRRVDTTSESSSRPILSKDWRIMKASFFFSSLPSSGYFLLRRFLASTHSLAFFSSGVGLMRASAKLRDLSLCLGRHPLLM